MLHGINYEGVIAFELFETKKGRLLVNEAAPRVHNSGHYSMNALREDQFTLHIKAVLNMDLYPPVLNAKGFAMVNLLGVKTPPGHPDRMSQKPKSAWPAKGFSTLADVLQTRAFYKKTLSLKSRPVYLHWYGKTPARRGRKMGHLNSLASTPEKALNQLLQFQKECGIME